ncbi:MAG: hypothetical protein M1822_008780 [Bathelium mastoideum]|nr:MAG: hypothetical protein M1822_008780 [Bathelium mastoideum]
MAKAARSRAVKSARGRSSEPKEPASPNAADIYDELLAEAASSVTTQELDRPLKRRKVWKPRSAEVAATSPISNHSARESTPEGKARVQTVLTETEQSEEDDLEWEDVAFQNRTVDTSSEAEVGPVSEGITLNLEDNKPIKAKSKKRTLASSLDKVTKIQAHRAHFLSLLMHTYIRNAWCNDREAQQLVMKLVPSKVRSSLTPDPGASQFQRDRLFKEGLRDLKDIWKLNFSPSKQGIKQPSWSSYLQPSHFRLAPDTERLIDVKDFRNVAKALEGSQDTGMQLLCAVLRALGVEARLICSLQTFSLATSPKDMGLKDGEDSGGGIDGLSQHAGSNAENSSDTPLRTGMSESPAKKRRLGQPSLGSNFSQPPHKETRRRTYKTKFPVYWVEAFNSALQKWTPIDPFSTDTIGKPSKLEPPASQSLKGVRMAYVIAFEENGVAKDVTRRYASVYNAKTRKERIESTEGGGEWLKKAMRMFQLRGKNVTDRDQIEAAELAKKEAQEGMPRAIQDFKDHPVYALERHLRRNEVIHPKREVGKVGVTGKAAKLEPVYRRVDVKVARSADKWYRLGREVLSGEQPLKHLVPKKASQGPSVAEDIEIDADGDGAGTPLYAFFQTQLYTPPPCMRGRVPKNAFGNIDVYVPSMIPPGGKHIRDSEAFRAARLIEVDYADAVTGFEFKGRRGTAVTQGIVVAQEFAAAIYAVLESMEYAKEQSEEDARSLLALRMWKRFLVGLRIVQRVNEYEIEGEKGTSTRINDDEVDESNHADELMDQGGGGGFFPDGEEIAMPTAKQSSRRVIDESEAEEDLHHIADDQSDMSDEQREDFAVDNTDLSPNTDVLADGGGFCVEEDQGSDVFLRDTSPSSDTGHNSHTAPDTPMALTPSDRAEPLPKNREYQSHKSESSSKVVRSDIEPVGYDQSLDPNEKDGSGSSSPMSPVADLEMQLALAESMDLRVNGNELPRVSTNQSMDNELTHEQPGLRDAPSRLLDAPSLDSDANRSKEGKIDPVVSISSTKEDGSWDQTSEAASEGGDRDSLLSHDPEDEEAEPEWLAEL